VSACHDGKPVSGNIIIASNQRDTLQRAMPAGAGTFPDSSTMDQMSDHVTRHLPATMERHTFLAVSPSCAMLQP
jgi:hypothetical protein